MSDPRLEGHLKKLESLIWLECNEVKMIGYLAVMRESVSL